MREFMNLVESYSKQKLRPTENDLRMIKQFRDDCRDDAEMGGQCSWVAEAINGEFGWENMSGTYCTKDGSTPVCVSHYWNILPDGAILDATADQMGEGHDIRIVEKTDPEFARYRPEWFSDYHPDSPDYDKNFPYPHSTEHWKGELDDEHYDRVAAERGHLFHLDDLTQYEKYLKDLERHGVRRGRRTYNSEWDAVDDWKRRRGKL